MPEIDQKTESVAKIGLFDPDPDTDPDTDWSDMKMTAISVLSFSIRTNALRLRCQRIIDKET